MIIAENISYKVGSNVILDNVSAQIPNGKVTAILGPNGAGKSTLLKCLTGTLQPNHGAIRLDDRMLSDYSLIELSKKRAVLSQSNPIGFPFTALEIVMMGRNPYLEHASGNEDSDIVQQALKCVDGWHLRDRIFPTLSGGEQQRIQLARVLAQLWEQENMYLFLDEPTSALDLKHQHQLLGLTRQLAQKKNFAVCIIMHDLNLAKQYTNQAILLRHGQLFISGDINAVLLGDHIEQVFEVSPELVFSYQKSGEAA